MQIRLDEADYRTLKHRAQQRGVSMSALLREILRERLCLRQTPRRVEEFRFIGSGKSGQRGAPISERHDEALSADFC
jgi:hypothetical protein